MIIRTGGDEIVDKGLVGVGWGLRKVMASWFSKSVLCQGDFDLAYPVFANRKCLVSKAAMMVNVEKQQIGFHGNLGIMLVS